MITSNTNGKRKTDSCDDESPRAKKNLQTMWDSTVGRGWNPQTAAHPSRFLHLLSFLTQSPINQPLKITHAASFLCFFACACLFSSLEWNFSPLRPNSRVISFARQSQAKFITLSSDLPLHLMCSAAVAAFVYKSFREGLSVFFISLCLRHSIAEHLKYDIH